MSPLSSSDSVDAFLSWLATPANPSQSTIPHNGRAGLSDSEYAARLRELAKSPLEDMAKPLLGPVPNGNGNANGHASAGGHKTTPNPQKAKKTGNGNGNGSGKKKKEAETRSSKTKA